jgi:hypothetical protein
VLNEAVGYLTTHWQTTSVTVNDFAIQANFMRLVAVPQLADYPVSNESEARKAIDQLTHDLFVRHGIDAFFIYMAGRIYCRLSCFVYNSISDYTALGDVMTRMKAKTTATTRI